MKLKLSKIWFPVAVTAIAAVQTFGMDVSRNGLWHNSMPEAVTAPDTVIYSNTSIYTKFRDKDFKVSVDTAAFVQDSTPAEKVISARDTMKAPDSLRLTDPFRYKYYVALRDSLTHALVRDSLRNAGDSLIWPKLDSIYYADSVILAKLEFEAWYASLDKAARKAYDFEQKMKRRQHQVDSALNVKDSLMAIRDSIRESKPRVLETYVLPDSLHYKRIVSWTKDPLFNDAEIRQVDTSYNYWFYDYPIYRKDVGASYLGIIGSPSQTFDFFKRKSVEGISFYQPLEVYSYSPSTLPMYNTKTPYTELAYWGTLFANAESEESEVHILTSQNLFPSLNMTLGYDRVGANGMLKNEDVDNRTVQMAVNYIGKRYAAHAGYIYNKMSKSENGGVVDNFWIRDTTVGAREIDVHLANADNLVKKNTVFLDQTYRIPFSFIKDMMNRRDTLSVAADSLGSADTEAYEGIGDDVTTAFIGHNSEYSVVRKVYKDVIEESDRTGRDFYNNRFYLNPTTTMDSLRVMKLENKVFLKLQPWSPDAIVSNLNVGLGNRIMNYYMFSPDGYLSKGGNNVWNSTYLYGGVGGQYRKFVDWSASGYYTFLGDEINDTGLNADASFSFFPFRRHKDSPVTVSAHFETVLDEPEFYQQHYYSNHYIWDNDFGKISTSKIEGKVSVPHWNLALEGGYSLLNNNIYYDTLGIVRQNTKPMSVAKVSLKKDFRFGMFHLDNTALFQVSSNKEVLPLPTLALNLRWYAQMDVVKKVMQLQVGVNGTYTTKWYAPAYSPALGLFHNQNKEEYGNGPYFDIFANIQWKRACVFVKYINAGMGWPMDSADYFSAHGYIRPQRAVKFGIFWPFYTQPRKMNTMSSKIGGMSGGSAQR